MSTSRRVVRRPADTLPEDRRSYDEKNRKVISSDPGVTTTAVITSGADDVPTLVPAPRRAIESVVEFVPADRARDLDALTAMEIGLGLLLQGIIFTRHDLQALMDNNDLQSDDFRLERVIYDWPRQEEDVEPLPSALIHAPGERTYGHQNMGNADLLEETVHVFGRNTVLRKLASVTTELEVTVWSAHKEERRAIVAGLERSLLAEPGDGRSARRVVVEHYFDRVARYDLKTIAYADTAASAQSNRWVLQARIAAEIDRVVLVPTPGPLTVQTTTVISS